MHGTHDITLRTAYSLTQCTHFTLKQFPPSCLIYALQTYRRYRRTDARTTAPHTQAVLGTATPPPTPLTAHLKAVPREARAQVGARLNAATSLRHTVRG